MNPLRIIYLEEDEESAILVEQELAKCNLSIDISIIKTRAEYLTKLEQCTVDLILSESQIEDFSGYSAFEIVQEKCPDTPFVFVYQSIDTARAAACLHQGAVDCVAKDQLWRLGPLVQKIAAEVESQRSRDQQKRWIQGMQQLIGVVQDLSLARDLETITTIVRRVARKLMGADGATFILQEENQCYYVDEDAISPLWKGRRFPIESCIGGWCMTHQQQVIINDVYQDDRIPLEAYRPTFIKSLVVVPIRVDDPIGAIATYWAHHRTASSEEVQLLQALADTTSVAIENVQVYLELEQRVRDRTAQLEAANQELKAFAYTLSHDLRTPLASISVIVGLIEAKYGSLLGQQGVNYLERLRANVQRINTMIDDILTLHRVTQLEMQPEEVDLTKMARDVIAELRAREPNRPVTTVVQDGLRVYADPSLLRVLLENLLSNAWKYTSKRSQPLIEVGALSPDSNGTQGFCVHDNGAGFDSNRSQQLFTPFQRLHSQSEFPGTGVGLASVERIVQKHGGRVWAEAAVDQGATFYVALPSPPATWV